MRRAARSPVWRVALVALLVVVAGCGQQSPTRTPTPSIPSPSPAATTFAPYGAAGSVAPLAYPHRTVFVQLFEWRWTDVAKECEQWLGPHGFAAVQVSPPQEHAVIDSGGNHFPWWERYQPVSYKLESRSGTRAEFADMVARCRAAGVEVYADVILNHMASGDGTGTAGTVHAKYSYPGLYGPTDFHANANPLYPDAFCNHSMNAGDASDVQTCELSGLADLRTEEPAVQDRLAAYLADLYSLGVRGYRIDAAKHIAEPQLAAILTRLRERLRAGATFFVDQEITDFGGDAVPKTEYYPLGSVDDFVYAQSVQLAFVMSNESLAGLEHLDQAGFVSPSDKAVVFVDNHDSQRGHIGNGLILSYRRGPLYTLAETFMLAYPLGYPRLMSSYVFTDTEAGPPSDSSGHTNTVYAAGSSTPNCGLTLGQWVCEQRWHALAGMVGFRDFTDGAPLSDWWSDPADANQIAFGRGALGFVVINRSATPLAQTLHTSLPPGRYCDVVGGDVDADRGSCTGLTIAVGADGTARFDVPPMTAVAIHAGSRLGSPTN